jgi:site-specific DNA-methyltransferase (adenine-specific)
MPQEALTSTDDDFTGGWLDRVHTGDCLELLPQLQAGIADLVFADPPFNIGQDYDSVNDRRPADQYLAWSALWIDECRRLLKPEGSLVICIGDEFAAKLEVLAEGQMSLGMIPARPRREWLYLRHHIIWYYTFGLNCTRRLTRSHTHLLHLSPAPGDGSNFYEEAVRVPSARQAIYNDKRANPDGRLPDDTWILRPQDGMTTPEHSVWYFPRVCGTYREKRKDSAPNQMPEQLLGRVIRLLTKEGDLVLDPFAGTGTTAATAIKLGRHSITTELSPRYAEQAQARVAAARPGQMLDGPPQ